MEQTINALKTVDGLAGRLPDPLALLRRIAELEARLEEQTLELERLRADRDLYRIVADFTSDWEYWIDAAGTLRYVSPSCEFITGYPPQFFKESPSSMDEIIHPDDRAAVAEYGRDAGPEDSSIHFRITTLGGQERWIAQRQRAVFDAEGRWLGRRVSNRDITEIKLKLKDEARNRSVIERFSQELDVIAKIGRVISSSLDIEKVYERFVYEAGRLIPCDRTTICLILPDEHALVIAFTAGVQLTGRNRGDVRSLSGTITETLMRTRQGLFINPKDPDEIGKRFPGCIGMATRAERMYSVIAVPLISQDAMIGSLLLWRKADAAFSDQDLRLLERIGEQIAGAVANAKLYTQLKETENSLRLALDERERLVQERTFELREVNTALKFLLKKMESEHLQFGEQLQSNIRQLVLPFLDRLKSVQTDHQGLTYLKVLETNLDNILSPFVNQLSVAYKNLTPKEIQIAALISQGKKSREIAEILSCSPGTIISHRNNIRKKLKLRGNSANLRSHLLSI